MSRKLLSILLIGMLVLSGCGKEEKETQGQLSVSEEENKVKYEVSELTIPDALQAENAQGSDYVGNDFQGFISDPQGKPALYYCSFSLENEEYSAAVTRWTLAEETDWQDEDLCENSLSEFLNQKYEQVEWKRFQLDQFRRGDDGSLYGILTYYVKETKEEDGEMTEFETQKFSILELDEENDRVFEIPIADVSSSVEKENRPFGEEPTGIDFTNYHAFEDGNILLIYTESGSENGRMIDGETGQTVHELGNIVNGRRRFAFGESELIFFSNDSMKFQVLSMPDLEEQNVFGSQLNSEIISKDWFFSVNPDTWELFLCNETGVYQATGYQDSDDVTCLTSGTDMSALVEGEGMISDFYMADEKDFYVCLQETVEEYGEETSIYRMLHYQKPEE